MSQVGAAVTAKKPAFKAVALAKSTAFVRSRPRLLAAIDLARFLIRTRSGPVLHCPLCGVDRRFLVFGSPPRPNAACPSCGSVERHRMLGVYLQQNPGLIHRKTILHFAPEDAIKRCVLQLEPEKYLTADLSPVRGDIVLSIEDITLSDRFDMIIASHILEHVNDRVALRELYRTLTPGGLLVVMVPIIEGWATTYENDAVRTMSERVRHFGQEDHVRYYGRDIRDRIREAGFELEEFTGTPAECLKMGLKRGETIFLAWKPLDIEDRT